MKTYMNKKNSETVTLIAVTADSRYIIETAAGAQKSYSESSFKKMFKFIEEVDDNQTALDTTDVTDAETTEADVTADTSSDETVEVVVDDTTEGEPVPAPADNGWEKIAKTNIKLLKKDGYYTPVVAKKTKKSAAASVDSILVTMVAFTGMNIGNFSAVKTGDGYAVTTKAGKTLHFDECGIQTDAKNPKFGNKLIFA